MHRVILSAVAAVALIAMPRVSLAQQDSVFIIQRNEQTLMRVNANGNVGIGVPMPLVKLHILGGLAADSIRTGSVRFSDGSALTTAAPATRHQAVYGSGWGSSPGELPVTFMKDQNGVVYLQGTAATTGTAGRTVFTLPEGYRPSHPVVLNLYAMHNDNTTEIETWVMPDGTVSISSTAQKVWFNNIIFLAAQ